MMAVLTVFNDNKDLYDQWSERIVAGIRVKKEFTWEIDNVFQTIQKGQESTEYSFCYFTITSEEGIECKINIATIIKNPNYFEMVFR